MDLHKIGSTLSEAEQMVSAMSILHEQVARFTSACADMVEDLRGDIAEYVNGSTASAAAESTLPVATATKKKTRRPAVMSDKHRSLVPAWKRMRDRGLTMTQCCRTLHVSNEHGRLMEDAAYGMKLKEAK